MAVFDNKYPLNRHEKIPFLTGYHRIRTQGQVMRQPMEDKVVTIPRHGPVNFFS